MIRSRSRTLWCVGESLFLCAFFFMSFLFTPVHARPHYPTGTCVANCTLDPQPCPGQTCGPLSTTACNRYLVPTSDPAADVPSWTYCMLNFPATCTDDHLGCPRCALRYIATRRCDYSQRCTPAYQDGYAILRSSETTPAAGPGLLCFTDNQYMIVPTRPCTGMESPDPKCTGREGEKYWGYAWEAAFERGFSANPTSDLKWGVALNIINGRSQHQAHFRLAPLKTTENSVVANFMAQPGFSTSVKAPTFTFGDFGGLFGSVFVPLPDLSDAKSVATRVQPFKRAAQIAKAMMPLSTYGILITPFQQLPTPLDKRSKAVPAILGRASTKNVTGVVVTAFFNLRGTVLLDRTVSDTSPSNCITRCDLYGPSSAAAAAAQQVDESVDPLSDMALFGYMS